MIEMDIVVINLTCASLGYQYGLFLVRLQNVVFRFRTGSSVIFLL